MVVHVEDGECKCDDCYPVEAPRKPKSSNTKKKAPKGDGVTKKAAKGKSTARRGSTGDSATDEEFEAAKDAIAVAKKEIIKLLSRDPFSRFIVRNEEAEALLDEIELSSNEDGKSGRKQQCQFFSTATPKKKGKWGAWNPDTHLGAFKENSKKFKSGYQMFFAHCVKECCPENLLFYTACCQLESLRSDRGEYFKLFDKIYEAFVSYSGGQVINLSYEARIDIEKVITTYRYMPEDTIDIMDAARFQARRMLFDTLFNAFRDEKAYKKSDRQVNMFDPTPNRPDPNLDYWLHEGKKTGFKTFMKFAKKKGDVFVNLLDFYTVSREFETAKRQELFFQICETHIILGSEKRVEELGRVLLEDLGFEYRIMKPTGVRARR